MRILVGTDPEVFIKDTSSGRMVSAHGQFPGSKKEPVPLGPLGFMQVDGHALEFNIHPAESEDEFVNNVSVTLQCLREEVSKRNSNWEIALEPVARFDLDYFEGLPEDSKILGCDPDFNSETGEVIPAPHISDVPMRTGSGHIHIGFTMNEEPFEPNNFFQRQMLAKEITPFLLEAAKAWENDNSTYRRDYYGGHGSFRPKSYGIELRALDNLWLKDENSMRSVYRAAVEGFRRSSQYLLIEEQLKAA